MVKFPRVFTGLWAFHKAFYGLIRRLQTTVEHMRVTNNTTDMVRGEVISLADGGARLAIRADADVLTGGTPWAGIMAENTVANATGIARTNGYAYVLFDTGLTLNPGDQVFLSQTAGRATNVAPTDAGSFVQKIGVLGDTSPYAANDAAWVWLKPCCAPLAR